MPKWADYLVSAVRFNAHGTHIETLRCHEDLGDSFGDAKVFSRETVVKAILGGRTFATIVKQPDGKYRYGAPLQTVTLSYVYLKTKSDNIIQDNLDELPVF